MFKKYFIIVVSLLIVVYGIISVNIYNTKALSPLGNTDDNFKKVSSEFGEDFSEFIKDKSPMKIYIGEENDSEANVNIYGKTIKLTKNNPFLKGVKPIIEYTKKSVSSIRDKLNKNTDNINVEKSAEGSNNTSDNKELDGIVDDFIKIQSNGNN